MPVLITETAAREINSIIHAQDLDAGVIRLRVGVKGGGCSGFSYILDLTETQRDTDEEWSYTFDLAEKPEKVAAGAPSNGVSNGVSISGSDAPAKTAAGGPVTVRVICDPKSYLYLNGTTIDFKDELMGRGFVFENPNATSTCGCGSSFGA